MSAGGAQRGSRPADLVIVGRVATLDGESGFGWHSGVAIRDGRVLAVGDRHQLEPLCGPRTTRWHLGDGEVVTPGITDAHLHLMTLVLAERQVDLTGLDLPATLAAVRTAHEELLGRGDADGWLLGHGWSLHHLGGWPDAQSLAAVAPGRPIALFAHDHHTRWVSVEALRRAGLGASTVDPAGGLVRRVERGQPTGILHETASVLVDHAIPDPPAAELEAALGRVATGLLALGVTGCHDPGELTAGRRELVRGPVFYRALAARDALPLRVHASVRAQQLQSAIEIGLRSGQATGRYTMGWLKLFADGSLGSRSAALLEPYADAAEHPPTGGPAGMYLTGRDELAGLLAQAAEAGIAGQVHAIGDGAVRMALDVLGAVPVRANGGLMRRVEHAQLVDPADVARFGRLGVAASVQPVHLRSDAGPARSAWGGRSDNAFPLRGIVEAGGLIPMGTDAPVEPPDPWPGIAVAVCRRDPFDEHQVPSGAQHALDLSRALRAACLDPALVAGLDDLGRLLPGRRADLLVVPATSLREPVEPATLATTRPLATLIDGRVVHRGTHFDR